MVDGSNVRNVSSEKMQRGNQNWRDRVNSQVYRNRKKRYVEESEDNAIKYP